MQKSRWAAPPRDPASSPRQATAELCDSSPANSAPAPLRVQRQAAENCCCAGSGSRWSGRRELCAEHVEAKATLEQTVAATRPAAEHEQVEAGARPAAESVARPCMSARPAAELQSKRWRSQRQRHAGGRRRSLQDHARTGRDDRHAPGYQPERRACSRRPSMACDPAWCRVWFFHSCRPGKVRLQPFIVRQGSCCGMGVLKLVPPKSNRGSQLVSS